MKKIAVYGAGGFGREVAFLIHDINKKKHEYDFIGYFDDGKRKGERINDSFVLGGFEELDRFEEDLCVALAIANPDVKRAIVNKLNNNKISFPTLIHPSVIKSGGGLIKIGKGCIVCAGNIITVNIEIGDFVILNLSCTVGHDTIINSFCSFMPSINISGEVRIGEGVYVGTGAKIINQLSIGANSTIGAGAVVVNDIPDNCTAVGVPAKVIKRKS